MRDMVVTLIVRVCVSRDTVLNSHFAGQMVCSSHNLSIIACIYGFLAVLAASESSEFCSRHDYHTSPFLGFI